MRKLSQELKDGLARNRRIRDVYQRAQDGNATPEEVLEAFGSIVRDLRYDEPSELESESFLDDIMADLKKGEIEAAKALPGIVEHTNALLPEHVSVELRDGDPNYVNVMWKGMYAGTVSYRGGTFSTGHFFPGNYRGCATLVDAAVLTTFNLIRGYDIQGYIQQGQHLFKVGGDDKFSFDTLPKLIAEVKQRQREGWKILKFTLDSDDPSYGRCWMQQPKGWHRDQNVELTNDLPQQVCEITDIKDERRSTEEFVKLDLPMGWSGHVRETSSPKLIVEGFHAGKFFVTAISPDVLKDACLEVELE